MKYFDIQKVFSQIVAEKLNEHCVLFTEHMGGSQGEIAKIDYVDLAARLSRPNHMYRVLMENMVEYVDEEYGFGKIETVILSIRYYDEVRSSQTVWNNDGKVVFKKTYYKIGKDFYTCNRQAAEDAIKLKLSRRNTNDYNADIVFPVNTSRLNAAATNYVRHKVYRFAEDVVAKKLKNGGYMLDYTRKNGKHEFTLAYLKH